MDSARRLMLTRLRRLFYVYDEERDHATPEQITRAIWYRRVGYLINLAIPLFVSYAAVAPSIAAVAKSDDVGFVSASLALLAAMVLAVMHAFYLRFLTKLVLFDPPLQRIRLNDFLFPFFLGSAYAAYALKVTVELSLPEDPGEGGWKSFLVANAELAYVLPFVILYGLWLIRDALEIRHMPDDQGPSQTRKRITRWLWVCVDLSQVSCMAPALFFGDKQILSLSLVGVHLKDLTVSFTIVGLIILRVLFRQFQRANYGTMYESYLANCDTPAPPVGHTRIVLSAAKRVLDFGCANGLRLEQLLKHAIAVPDEAELVGVDKVKRWRPSFEKTFSREPYGLAFASDVSEVDGPFDVLFFSHADLRTARGRRTINDVLKRFPPASTQHVIFRGTSPASFFGVLSHVFSSDEFAPSTSHLWQPVHLERIKAEHSLKLFCKMITVDQSYRLSDNSLDDLSELVFLLYPQAPEDQARTALRQMLEMEQRKLANNDLIFVFTRTARTKPAS